ncbi:MAG: DUF2752 domain-containing protein [Acidimicrobiia bacterium]|nr:DUF2752 domain-containing protein [Acidimicrobiia bacterium]
MSVPTISSVRTTHARFAPDAAAATVGGICVVSALIDPAGGPTVCPLKAMTGIDCPLCGATRAAHQLFRGNLVAALDFNAVFVIAAPLLILAAFAVVRQALGGSPARVPKVSRTVIVGVVVAIAVFTVVRNLGVAPFDWLSSTA